MDIRKELLKQHSKAQTTKIARFIGDDKERFDELMQLFLYDESQITQRAAWVMSYCCEAYGKLLTPYLSDLINYLQEKNLHDAVKRNIFRVFQYVNFSDEYAGSAYDAAYKYFTSRSEAIAIRVFALTVLVNICKKYPELKDELIPIIEEELYEEEVKPAYISRAKKALVVLRKL